ncbi:MAG: toll/interleukin-1 receptor domain-containing protein [Pseudomonadota bacterium]
MAKVFFSYSHKDEALRDEFEVHLAMLKREGAISAWHDRKILPGTELNGEINARLNESEVILLLVSPDFLASAYCYDIEVGRAMEMHEQGRAKVIPVILRPCDWQASAPFAKLLAVPTDGKPVVKWPDRDDAWLNVVQQLRAALPKPHLSKVVASTSFLSMPPSRSEGPRSSNLRIRKEFSDAEKDNFLDDAFGYIEKFFENSLQELQERHSNLETKFKRIDARSFTAAIYQNGKSVARCGIRFGGF